ncbi:hypothetical protein DVS28_b0095 (plasmid) [Euzebya pacifica]|uniref:DUF559 domain-containing protein n=1 Tax=Euzebya pacifica TaxID=1608957 RepID=A0A346Y5W8_9ACTN|nr:hypothetical protein DVS28_b0095 [Euzebya pacifica]
MARADAKKRNLLRAKGYKVIEIRHDDQEVGVATLSGARA